MAKNVVSCFLETPIKNSRMNRKKKEKILGWFLMDLAVATHLFYWIITLVRTKRYLAWPGPGHRPSEGVGVVGRVLNWEWEKWFHPKHSAHRRAHMSAAASLTGFKQCVCPPTHWLVSSFRGGTHYIFTYVTQEQSIPHVRVLVRTSSNNIFKLFQAFSQKKKKEKSCHLQQHGWTFRALCWVKQER